MQAHRSTEPKVAKEPQAILDELSESESRFRIMADCAPVLLWMSEPNSLCSFFNQTWLDFTGRTMDQELGSGWAEGIHPEDFQRSMDIYMAAFVNRQKFRMEYRLRRADGEYRWLLDQGVPRFSSAGTFSGFIGSCVDITDMKRAQFTLGEANTELDRRVQERTRELMRSNQDLEQFAYVASHDLQEPLRMIASYMGLLQDRYRGRLDRDADVYIHYAVDGAIRLQALIKGLLRYAKLNRTTRVFEDVNCDRVLDTALENLTPVTAEKPLQITREPLPTIRAEPTQLTQLFQNLIGNAIKFCKGEAKIHIAAKQNKGEWTFSVADNGIGIDPRYQEKIFRVFQRLHRREEYPGTGIGLAICKKVVEGHHGKIWVESDVGRGSTFYFSLPERLRA